MRQRLSLFAIVLSLIPAITVAIVNRLFTPPSDLVLIITLSSVLVVIVLYNSYNSLNKLIKKAMNYRSRIMPIVYMCYMALVFIILYHFSRGDVNGIFSVDVGYTISILTFWLVFVREMISSNVERNVVGLAATCIPLRENNGKIETLLIFNPNFEQWMFPGGHVNLQDGEFPEEVAESKAQSEAGVTVRLLSAYNTTKEYRHCKPRNAPPFVYLLDIDIKAKCNIVNGHEKHLDFTYVGDFSIIESLHGEFDRIIVDIDVDCNDAARMGSVLRDRIERKLNADGKPIPSQLFPEDIPDRLCVAFKAYKKIKGLD